MRRRMTDDPRGFERLETQIGRVRFLLDNWDAIWGPFVSGGGAGGGSGLPPMLSKMASHPSVLELDRCLSELGRTDPVVLKHLKAYRVGVEWRCVTKKVKRRRARGKGFEMVDYRVREPIVPSWVDRKKVSDAESRLVSEFSGEVFVPDELWVAWKRPAMAA
jgi:hypothetical protein